MDTTIQIQALIDYKEVYGINGKVEEIPDLLRDIPSVTLISYISGFNIKLYLNDVGIEAHEIQIQLLNNLIVKAGAETIDLFKKIFQYHLDRQHWPVVIWRYSNLLFYDYIFGNYNNNSARDLTTDEAKRVLDAYLLINSITNTRFNINDAEVKEAAKNEEVESILLPNFIYQRDYVSTTDFSNQVTRGVFFFQYLEKSSKFSGYLQGYYKAISVNGYKDLFYNLLTVFAQIDINDIVKRNQFIPLWNIETLVNSSFISNLSINRIIPSYKPDTNFSLLRNHVLYEIGNMKLIYFLLDINFLIDQFYKAQVFSFKEFLKIKGYTGNFLSEKAKEFMEGIYFKIIMERCFPHLTNVAGDRLIYNKNEEISDYYLRDNNRVALIEFKDTLLASTVKDKGEKSVLYSELDTKFFKNQKGKPKGVNQLKNGIIYIENNKIDFDTISNSQSLELYPVIIYTDFSFGYEGINKIFNKKFRAGIEDVEFKKVAVRNVTFINLNFFELHEDYLKQGRLNLFDMIDEYHIHVLHKDYSTTPFEVFSKFYMQKNLVKDLGSPSFMRETINENISGIKF